MDLRVSPIAPPTEPVRTEGPQSNASVQRAVLAQANVTGAASNVALQSSMQTERDRAAKKRQDALLGRTLAVDATAALAPAHTATGEDDHSPAEPRDYLYRRRRRQPREGKR